MEKFKKSKGITLIALILTIIILIIIAVVSINSVSEQGIILKVKQAKTDYEEAADLENVQLAMQTWILKNASGTKTNEEFRSFLIEKFEEKNVTGDNGIYDINIKYRVYKDGTVKKLVMTGTPLTTSKGILGDDGIVYVVLDESEKTAIVYGNNGLDFVYNDNNFQYNGKRPEHIGKINISAKAKIENEVYTVTTIRAYAFSLCEITSIDMPDIIEVRDSAFKLCSQLKNVNMRNVSEIGTYAFFNCSKLKNVEINMDKYDRGEITIAEDAFQGTTIEF